MSQELLRVVFTLIYSASSFAGASLFIYIWIMARDDRKWIAWERGVDPLRHEQRRTVSRRNEIVAGILALNFIAYSAVSAIAITRLLGLLDLPWVEGLVTTPLLVLGNLGEMAIAIILVKVRRNLNRSG